MILRISYLFYDICFETDSKSGNIQIKILINKIEKIKGLSRDRLQLSNKKKF